MVPSHTARAVLILLVIFAVALVVVIALPFATSFFLAAVLAGALAPATKRLTAFLGGRRKLASLVLTLAVFVAIVGPLSALGAVLVPQVESGIGWLREALKPANLEEFLQHLPARLQPTAEHVRASIPSSLDRLQAIATAQGARAAAFFANLLTATGTVLLQGLLMLIALFFLLADGRQLVEWLNDAIPLKRGQVLELVREFRRVAVTVLVSTIATGGVQSLAAVAGYVIARVPNAAFFGFITFIVSLVPALGATVVVLAVGVVKLVTGHTVAGIFLLAWALGVVGLIDNVVKPIFIRGGVPIHGAIIFFALLGGLAVFGPIGFLVGPLAVTFLVAVARMYQRDYGA
jgi:predicted PurR-regulated permease PerM